MDPDIASVTREARRARRLPVGSTCDTCHIANHLSLRPDGGVLCYACVRAARGAGPTELDHVAGRANLGGLLVTLRANDHRTVTETRLRLGFDTWPTAGDDPLLTLAHLLAGLASLLILLAEWLVALAADVSMRLGPGAWEGAPLGPVVP